MRKPFTIATAVFTFVALLNACTSNSATSKVPRATQKSDQSLSEAPDKTECAELGIPCGSDIALVCCDDSSCVVGVVGASGAGILTCSGTPGSDEYCADEIDQIIAYCDDGGGGGGSDTGYNDTGRRR
jgi:hypothetical protein